MPNLAFIYRHSTLKWSHLSNADVAVLGTLIASNTLPQHHANKYSFYLLVVTQVMLHSAFASTISMRRIRSGAFGSDFGRVAVLPDTVVVSCVSDSFITILLMQDDSQEVAESNLRLDRKG